LAGELRVRLATFGGNPEEFHEAAQGGPRPEQNQRAIWSSNLSPGTAF
jgi:hypothetical protein